MLRPESLAANLVSLPSQPKDLAWPTLAWERGEPTVSDSAAFGHHTASVFDLAPDQGVTYALLVVHKGRLVYERYAHGASPIYTQVSWSMAKSVTHALVGIAAEKGLVDLYAPAPVPEWQDDRRAEITLDQLLRMSSGLAFREEYVDPSESDAIPMLAGPGRHDMGAFAAGFPLEHDPGSVFSYSSGTSNVIGRILRDAIGGPTEMLAFMRETLFEPIGIRTALPSFDTAGTFTASSWLHMIPEDFARFGLLYLRDGQWDGERILPEGWVDYARSPTHDDGEEAYGAHWWLRPGGSSVFYASGYHGQRIVLAPEKDLAVIRIGRNERDELDPIWEHVFSLIELF
ncbi:MAG: serine hydrolase [Planctomycetes bacterium]|nr:serine hydrolase [Planctomycetota bacterium]